MKLQVKVILILASVWLIISLMIFMDTKYILASNYQKLEKTLINAEIEDANNAFKRSLYALSLYTLAWSQWDDAYDFMKTKSQKFIDSNFVPGTFASPQLNFLLFYDAAGKLYYGKIYDEKTNLVADPPAYLLNYIAAHNNFLHHTSTTSKKVEIFNTPGGLIIMDSLPIITGEGKGPIRGVILMGYFVTPERIKNIAETVGSAMQIYSLPLKTSDMHVKEAAQHLEDGRETYIINVDANTAFGYIMLKDIDKKPAAIISIKIERIVNKIGINTNQHFWLFVIFFGVVVMILMWYLLKVFVLNRVLSVSQQVVAINKENNFQQKLEVKGHDEIASMVFSINHMMRLITLSQNQLRYMANHDALTQLPNRTYFYELLDRALTEANISNTLIAVLFLDMDKFKSINDEYGHDVGDKLLKIIAQRLKKCIKDTDVVARQSGDEFIIFLKNIENLDMVTKTAQRMLDETSKKFVIKGINIHAAFSIGISMYPTDSKDIEKLIHFADLAMYSTKKQGNTFCFYKSLKMTL